MRTFLKSMIAAAAITFSSVAAYAAAPPITIISEFQLSGTPTMQYTDSGASGWSLSTIGTQSVFVTVNDIFTGASIGVGTANFLFNGTGTSFAVNTSGDDWSQAFTGGTLSLISTSAIGTIASGTNLLSLTWTGGSLDATIPGTVGSARVSLPGGAFSNVTSGVFDFPPARLLDFSIALSNATPCITFAEVACPVRGGVGGENLPDSGEVRFSNFTASQQGGFTAAVPEPGTWAMMLAGFGLVGLARRRNNRQVTVAA
ncbi:PEPxxWA-CTERM sorting domain-containing protein [Sandarakinorhabdus rubra]|uniref:PEPxxWA-CTERM sorting domain-containing protein n=1 Tax=Sandarakinorhabdus rubra TaxID=2672568 RepID=UPI001F2B2F25|nr:PEPxxWA-CTERM sorting domain-containing protein [Sandarakinorhabdus rubra]